MQEISGDVLITDLVQDALLVMERALNGLSLDIQQRVAAGIQVGGQMEVRIRLRAASVPRISIHLIGTTGESLELVAAP
jgi:uncharacterized linocin/CFP29 family protein